MCGELFVSNLWDESHPPASHQPSGFCFARITAFEFTFEKKKMLLVFG